MRAYIIYLILFAISFIGCTSSKSFNGIVTYDVEYISNFPQIMTSDSLIWMYGNQKTLYIRDSFYKYEMNGAAAVFTLYDPIEKFIYNKVNNGDSVFRFDATKKSNDSVISYSLEKKSMVVNNVLCNRLEIKTKYSTMIYFYNERFHINPSRFNGHEYEHWNYYLKIAKSLPLMVIYKNSMFTYSMTYTYIDEVEIEKDFFELNPNWVVLNGLIY